MERRRALLSSPSDRSTLQHLSRQKSIIPGSLALLASTAALLSISLLPSLPLKLLLSATVGGVASVWQLQVLHDALHSTFSSSNGVNKFVLFYLSLPSFVGYYTYLKFGHLGHHNLVSSRTRVVGLREVFDSEEGNSEGTSKYANTLALLDGDTLFARHRQVVGGEEGPLWRGKVFSISAFAQSLHRPNQLLRNMSIYLVSFSLERLMLGVNDVVTAFIGRDVFFPKKNPQFHALRARHARAGFLFKVCLLGSGGPTALLSLYVSELSWTFPFHPLAAVLYTNHGGATSGVNGECVPTASCNFGRLYDVLSLNTSLHREHHDFPGVPFHLLGKVPGGEERRLRRGTGVRRHS